MKKLFVHEAKVGDFFLNVVDSFLLVNDPVLQSDPSTARARFRIGVWLDLRNVLYGGH